MNNRRNYPRLRNGKLEGGGIPPHYVDEKNKEVLFHIAMVLRDVFHESPCHLLYRELVEGLISLHFAV